MTVKQLANKLKRAYYKADKKEQVASVMAFAIEFADDIREISAKELIESAGIAKSYINEVYRGVKLSKYVKVKPIK